ncbi:N-acetylmuramoyl-L-alanine amidase [Ferrimonas balearica]|nr:N-acetylmuramoyl-L-alanine amidase [Ferrimonas balearica]
MRKRPDGAGALRRIALWLVVTAGVMLAGVSGSAVMAQDFTARATVLPGDSGIRDRRGRLELSLHLSQGVPYRIFTLEDPRRIVLDFREVDWRGVDPAVLLNSDLATAVRMGQFRPGWSRMVIDLAEPLALEEADLRLAEDSGRARLTARFGPVAAEDFTRLSGYPETPGWGREGLVALPSQVPPKAPDGPMRILLDPGHGGIDPGAERAGVVEADLMLTFARELQEALVRSGAEVYLTREDDSFVSLEGRVAMAHALEADLFLSLHADALASGRALGTTVHTLARSASDEASRLLAERHDRADLLAGIDLSDSDDQVAGVLMDLARTQTQPRSEQLADAIVLALRSEGMPLNTRPRRAAGYSVLKAPDVPSVLIETGFLSSPRDRENLVDPAFRARLANAIRDGIQAWKIADDTLAPLRLK